MHHLATPMWLSHTWQFQLEHGIRIETTTPNIPLSWEGDQLLTVAFLQPGIKGKDLAMLNCCCMFLQVAMIADISEGTRFYVSDAMLTGQANTTFSSGYTWPNQNRPSKQDWARWHLGLHLAIPVDTLGHFQQPLSWWILPWDKHPNKWHWLLQIQPPWLYHWQEGWQLHQPLNTHTTCQLKFSNQHMAALHPPPTTVIWVTCTITATHIIP